MSDAHDRLASLSPEKRALLEKRLAAARASAPAVAAPPALEKIAIVSAACRFPGGARSPDEFWNLLLQGRDLIGEVPADRWDGAGLFSPDATTGNRMNTRSGGFIDGIDQFDAAFFGISPVEAAAMDPQQRLLLETAWEALEAAGQDVDRLAGSATGVFVGAHSHSSDYYLLQLAQKGGFAQHATTGSAHSILANRISYTLDLRGPSVALDTACSSSLVAIHLACQSLRTGESDLAIAGGVNLLLMPASSLAFAKLHLFSNDGRCRTFDAAASGIVRAEGVGLVVLKRLSQAVRDADPILAVIAGSAVNQDGLSNGITAPNGPSQVAVIQRALAMAGIAPERIGYVETHGTGTVQGDPVEVEALGKVIGPQRDPRHRCWLGAVKTNVGHLEAAAGVAGLVKAALALKHRRIPPNLHFQQLNPTLSFDGTPFAVPTSVVDWAEAQGPRVAGVSSFGFGGTNAHVVLEEHVPAKAQPARVDAAGDRFLAISARSPAALAQLARSYRDRLAGLAPDALDDLVHTANARRTHHPHRIGAVGRDAYALAQDLERRIGEREKAPAASRETPAPVFVFGEANGWAAMARELHASEPAFRGAFDAVAKELEPYARADSAELLADASEVVPVARLAFQVALAALWASWGVRPGAVAGEGAGEIAAAHAAGVLTLGEAVNVAWHRGRTSGAAIAQALAGLQPKAPALPIVSSATGAWASARDFDAAHWARDPQSGSRLAQGRVRLGEAGYRLFVELGAQGFDSRAGARSGLLAALRSLYEAGLAIDWPGRADPHRRVVALPAYPWQHQRHWLESADVAALAFNVLGKEVSAAAPSATQCWEMQWRPAPRAAAPAARMDDAAWMITADRGGIGRRLAESIRAQGAACETIDAGEAAGLTLAQWKARLDRLATAHPGKRVRAVHCAGLDAPLARDLESDAIAAAVSATMLPALHLAQSLAALPQSREPRLTLVTRGAQRVEAADRDFSPIQAMLWGFGRAVALERPDVWGALVDLDASFGIEASAAAILEELRDAGAEDQVGARASGRSVARLTARAAPGSAALGLDASGAYLVTGGYGGLGPKIARWLADEGAKCIVLLGRSGLPDAATWSSLPADDAHREAIAAILSMRERGIDVRAETGDVTDPESMGALFARLRAAGKPIRGVVHAAVAFRYQSLESLTPSDLEAAFRAKVQGTWLLHELTRDGPLDLFVMFSSASATVGAARLAAYASANQFLDALAEERAAKGLPATCIGWGAWSRIRALGEKQHDGLDEFGFRAMDDARAFEILSGAVRAGLPRCMVASLDVARVCETHQARGTRPFLEELARAVSAAPATGVSPDSALPGLREALAALPPAERRERLAQLVRGETARVMGLAEPEAIDATKGFFELGLDSLMAMRLRRALSAQLGETLPATLTFKYPTIAALSEHLAMRLGTGSAEAALAPAPASAPPRPALAEVADADIQKLLQAELDSLPEDLR